MVFPYPLLEAALIKRYKRFLADIQLPSGEVITVHCPNSGSMKTCAEPGWPIMFSDSRNPERKYRYTWEMVHNGECWIGINTHLANKIVVDGVEQGLIPELRGYPSLRTEVKYGRNSRIDILLENNDRKCYVEVKNVTLAEDGIFKFPDAVTVRGQKHLAELMAMIDAGHRAVMVYLIQRSDGRCFQPAAEIDPVYARRLREAYEHGVEILPYRAVVSPDGIWIAEKLSFVLF